MDICKTAKVLDQEFQVIYPGRSYSIYVEVILNKSGNNMPHSPFPFVIRRVMSFNIVS